jgi:N-methylhydantoinase B
VGPAALTIHSPAGGGWGNPFSRDPELVFQDVRDGLLSREKAEEDYGVILSPDYRAVDYSKTADIRRQKCS